MVGVILPIKRFHIQRYTDIKANFPLDKTHWVMTNPASWQHFPHFKHDCGFAHSCNMAMRFMGLGLGTYRIAFSCIKKMPLPGNYIICFHILFQVSLMRLSLGGKHNLEEENNNNKPVYKHHYHIFPLPALWQGTCLYSQGLSYRPPKDSSSSLATVHWEGIWGGGIWGRRQASIWFKIPSL